MSVLRLDQAEVRLSNFRLGPFRLELEPGEYFGVLGPSGSGKSTLLRAVAGLVPLAGGSIELGNRKLDGEGIRIAPEQRHVGMVFQNLALWPHLTVVEHLRLVLRAQPLSQEEREKRIADTLDRARIAHRKDRKPGEISGGEAQRLALARALVVGPEILLLDEPLGQLDPILRQEIAAELRSLHRDVAIPVLHVTHDPGELIGLARRAALLHEGQIAQVGTFAELIERPATPFVASFFAPLREMLDLLREKRP